MGNTTPEKWTEKLSRAALPGAVKVAFFWTKTVDGHAFSLKSWDEKDQAIGDARDYDLLKVHFEALGALAESEGFAPDTGTERSAMLNLATQTLTISP